MCQEIIAHCGLSSWDTYNTVHCSVLCQGGQINAVAHWYDAQAFGKRVVGSIPAGPKLLALFFLPSDLALFFVKLPTKLPFSHTGES